MKISESISELLDGVRKAYQEDQIDKGIRASGKSAASLRPEVNVTGDSVVGTLYGAKYFYQQKNGRRPGKFPPIEDVLNWIRVKGIVPRDNKTSTKQLAFLFARKIAQKGTDIYLKKRPALNPEEKIKELMKEFSKNVLIEFKEAVKA